MKILIVEDNVIIAEDIKDGLKANGYTVSGIAHDYDSALEIIEHAKVEFVIIDIILSNNSSGIDLAREIRSKHKLPFIFLTSHGDTETVELALRTEPNGYLMKPFERKELYASIEVALLNYNSSIDTSSEDVISYPDSIFVKNKSVFKKVKYDHIEYLKSDGNYLEIHTAEEKKFLLRMSIKNFMSKTSSNTFFQTNRSYAVNVQKVESVGNNFVTVGTSSIPLAKDRRQLLITMIPFLS